MSEPIDRDELPPEAEPGIPVETPPQVAITWGEPDAAPYRAEV